MFAVSAAALSVTRPGTLDAFASRDMVGASFANRGTRRRRHD